MQLEKPKVQRIYVTVTDPDKESPSRSETVYGSTPELFFENLQRLASADFDAAERLIGQLQPHIARNTAASAILAELHKFLEGVRPAGVAV